MDGTRAERRGSDEGDRDSARERDGLDAFTKSALDDGRQIFGRNLLQTRQRHPLFRRQVEVAREMHALGYPGYATVSDGIETIVAKKISKYEHGVITPPLPEAAALARVLNTTLDALTDTRGTVETFYDTAEEAWTRFTSAVLAVLSSLDRADSAIRDFRNAQDDLHDIPLPLYAPEGFGDWSQLWDLMGSDALVELRSQWGAHYEAIQAQRSRQAKQAADRSRALRSRILAAERSLEGANLKRSLANILRNERTQTREFERELMDTPERQLSVLSTLSFPPQTPHDLLADLSQLGGSDSILVLRDDAGNTIRYHVSIEPEADTSDWMSQ